MTAAVKAIRDGPHLSVSSLTTWLMCPRKHEMRYSLKLPAEHRPAQLCYGRAVHAALAKFYAAARDNIEEPSADELADAFKDAWEQELDCDIPVLFGDKDDDSKAALTDSGVELIKVFHAEAPRYDEILSVEQGFRIDLLDDETGEVLPALVGYIDAVAHDGQRHVILEHKATKAKWTADRLQNDLQLTAYHLVAPLLGYGDNPAISVQLLLRRKSGAAFVALAAERTKADHRDFIEVVRGVHDAITAGISYPLRGWWCPCEYGSACAGR